MRKIIKIICIVFLFLFFFLCLTFLIFMNVYDVGVSMTKFKFENSIQKLKPGFAPTVFRNLLTANVNLKFIIFMFIYVLNM